MRFFCCKLVNSFKIQNMSKRGAAKSGKGVKSVKKPPKIEVKIDPKMLQKVKFEVLDTPTKSQQDLKNYKVIRLANGLTACLISEKTPLEKEELGYSSESDYESSTEESGPESEDEHAELSEGEHSGGESDQPLKKTSEREQKMAAAALCISVGSFSDPKEIQGLAHFLEHMVFMGSKKYPQENDFDSFLKKRGGSDNASTDCENTTFYFECLEKHLLKALDKFAQFFISPLMKQTAMTREREAIESEFQMALPNDSYRKEQLLSSLANSGTPVTNFTWGNLVTLRDNVNDDVLYKKVHEFRQRHYSAHRMTLAIQARLPLEELESYVLTCFKDVSNNKLPPDVFKQFSTNVFNTKEFTRLYHMKPMKSVCQLHLTWCLPSLLDKYKSKPHEYVSWLLGHEGKGSLLSYLRKNVWTLGIYTGNEESGIEHNSMYAFFTATLVLTKSGVQNLNSVIKAVYSYLNMLKKIGPQERIFREIELIDYTSFRFQTEENPADYVEEIAESMQFYPPKDYLTGPKLISEYDPEGIKMVFNAMVPEKMNIIVLNTHAKENEINYDKTEKWFGTKYTDKEIPQEQITEWQNVEPYPEFHLPDENLFITKNFDLLPTKLDNPIFPQKIQSDPLVEIWYKLDLKFKLPIAYYHFYLVTPLAMESATSLCCLDMLVHLLGIELTEDCYPAQVADLYQHISVQDKGIVIKVNGYNEKLPDLIELICSHLKSISEHMTKDMFNAVKVTLSNSYYNKVLKPSSLLKDLRMEILLNTFHPLHEKHAALHKVKFNELQEFATKFLDNLFVKCLVQGNVSEEICKKTVNNFVSKLNYKELDPTNYPKYQVLEIPNGEFCCRIQSFNEKDSNSIVTNYYQCGPFDMKNSVIIELLMVIIEEPLFDILRTKEQLGYNVYSSVRDTFGILGYTITINLQATKYTTTHVDQRIEEFVKHCKLKILKKMSEKKFAQIKKDLIKTKQVADVLLKEEVDRNWSEISNDDYMFDRLQQEIEMLEKLKLVDLKNWWDSHNLVGNSKTCRKISFQVVGFDTKTDENKIENEENMPCEIQDDETEHKKLVLQFLTDTIKKENVGYVCNPKEFKKKLSLYPIKNLIKE